MTHRKSTMHSWRVLGTEATITWTVDLGMGRVDCALLGHQTP